MRAVCWPAWCHHPGKENSLARTPLRRDDPIRIGHYRLTARLGSGGMGVVYLGVAWDGSQVAVKVLRPELAGDEEFRRRFGREVAALVRVKGACTVRVIEADSQSPTPFVVTEYAQGPSLSEHIDKYVHQRGLRRTHPHRVQHLPLAARADARGGRLRDPHRRFRASSLRCLHLHQEVRLTQPSTRSRGMDRPASWSAPGTQAGAAEGGSGRCWMEEAG